MEYRVPYYYGEFRCEAGECCDTCCAGWAITIDDESMKRYGRRKGAFGSRLANSIDWKEGRFLQYQDQCVLLNEYNLCDIYTEAGKKSMCRTCRNYPRHMEEFEGVRELSLSLSCPAAAKLILGRQKPVSFLTKERERTERDPFFDRFLYQKLNAARETALHLMQNREEVMPLRMAMVLAFGHDLQCRIENERLSEAEELSARYEKPGAPERFGKRLSDFQITQEERFPLVTAVFGILKTLQHSRTEWKTELEEYERILYEAGAAAYGEKRLRFLKYIENAEERGHSWAVWGEQLMVYFLFTHFCGGVYDDNPYAKVKLAVVSTLLIEELAFAVWLLQGDTLSDADFLQAAYRYSREVEHSDSNLETLECSFTQKECSLIRLLKLIAADL